MNRLPLAFLILLFAVSVSAHGQSVARANPSSNLLSQTETTDHQGVAARAIAALKRLDKDVLVYHSLGDFEENGKLARVSFETFRNDLREVTEEVGPLLSRLPQSRLKNEISNALDSYRDGAFWWQKIDQPRVVHVSAPTSSAFTRTTSDTAFLSNVPYTVAIHWRQGGRYLKRAEELMAWVQNRQR